MPLVPGPGTEFANFGDRDLMLGLTSEEAWVNLTDEDLQVKGRRTCKWVDFTYSTGEESWWFVYALLFVLFALTKGNRNDPFFRNGIARILDENGRGILWGFECNDVYHGKIIQREM